MSEPTDPVTPEDVEITWPDPPVPDAPGTEHGDDVIDQPPDAGE